MGSEKFILITAGNPASGKDSYAAHFSNKYGAKTVGMSTLIREYADERGIKLSGRDSFHTAHYQLREELGPYALPDKLLGMEESVICANGLRVVAYQKYLHSHGAQTLAVWGSPATRYKHASNDPTRQAMGMRGFWLDELPEYFNRDPFGVATVSVMNNAHYHVSIEGKSLAEVAAEADALIEPAMGGKQR